MVASKAERMIERMGKNIEAKQVEYLEKNIYQIIKSRLEAEEIARLEQGAAPEREKVREPRQDIQGGKPHFPDLSRPEKQNTAELVKFALALQEKQ